MPRNSRKAGIPGLSGGSGTRLVAAPLSSSVTRKRDCLEPEGASMNARVRTAATYRVATTMLIALAVSGWAAFAYVSWSAARTERALQSQITRLTADRAGPAAPPKQLGHESATP